MIIEIFSSVKDMAMIPASFVFSFIIPPGILNSARSTFTTEGIEDVVKSARIDHIPVEILVQHYGGRVGNPVDLIEKNFDHRVKIYENLGFNVFACFFYIFVRNIETVFFIVQSYEPLSRFQFLTSPFWQWPERLKPERLRFRS